jgi:hypothetical protein
MIMANTVKATKNGPNKMVTTQPNPAKPIGGNTGGKQFKPTICGNGGKTQKGKC